MYREVHTYASDKAAPRNAAGGVIWLPVDELEPSPVQPRKSFPDGELQELSESIAQYGILNPLTVRLRDSRYELVAGERRLKPHALPDCTTCRASCST